MSELWLSGQNSFDQNAKVRVGVLAGRQVGRVTTAQLGFLGVSKQLASYWSASRYLFPQLPHVFAVGHPGRTEASDLFSAVLYAGPNAALSGLTAALWRGLVKWRTAPAIEVSTPRRCRSLPANHPGNHLNRPVAVRDRRDLPRTDYHGIPTTTAPQIALDLATTKDVQLVRFALAQMDFMRILDFANLERLTGRGVPGSQTLREAIERHQPLLARARSPFEIRLIRVCELTGIPLPDINGEIRRGITPDAIWWDEMVIVECDGEGNHGTWGQRRRDAGKDLILRGLGFLVIRYTYDQLDDPWAIHADLMPILTERAGRAGRLSA
jgi:hypothetical protein